MPLNGALPRDGAYSLAVFICDSRIVPPWGVSESNPAHDASRMTADKVEYIVFIAVRFIFWVGVTLECDADTSGKSPHCRVGTAVESRT